MVRTKEEKRRGGGHAAFKESQEWVRFIKTHFNLLLYNSGRLCEQIHITYQLIPLKDIIWAQV